MEQQTLTPDASVWINTDFLMKILDPDGNKDILINSWKVERASKPGTGFSSVVYRVTVELTREGRIEATSLIIKVEKNYLGVSKEFYREVNTYNIAIPVMNNLLQEAISEKFQHFAPICHYASVQMLGPIIVLEDLKKQSFKVAEMSGGLDFQHCLLVIRRLARYHAASAALFAKNPEALQHFKSSIYQDINLGSPRINFPPQFRKLAEAVNKLPEYRERFYDKLSKFAEELIDIFLDGISPDENEFNVLAHEDLWINNIMFQYEECKQEPADVRIIDYQMCSWASPGIDIQRFLLSLGSAEVLEQHEALVEEYYNILKHTLDKLGYQQLCPTMHHLNAEINRKAKFGILHGLNSRVDFTEDEPILTEKSKESIMSFLNFVEKKNWF